MKQLIEGILLTPAQELAYMALLEGVTHADVIVLWGRAGAGKTTVLKKAHDARGGAWLGMREYMRAVASHVPEAMEEAFLEMMEQALDANDIVFIDDLHLIAEIMDGYYYPRKGLLD